VVPWTWILPCFLSSRRNTCGFCCQRTFSVVIPAGNPPGLTISMRCGYWRMKIDAASVIAMTDRVGGRPIRPNGPGERSPGLRPQADALGGEMTMRCGLKGRETVGPAFEAAVAKPVIRAFFLRCPPGSRGLSGRKERVPFFPGHRPSASALGWSLPTRWAGGKIFSQAPGFVTGP